MFNTAWVPAVGTDKAKVRFGLAFFAFMFVVIATMLTAASADAAFNVTGYKTTPSSTQAGGHPNVEMKLSIDAASADSSGDDLQKVKYELPAGLLLNPRAVSTPCPTADFTADRCLASTQVGTIVTKLRVAGISNATAYGSVYLLAPTSGNVMSLGFIVRPSTTYQRLFFTSSKVTGLTSVRTGPTGDYGLTIETGTLPRYIKTTGGTQLSATISELTVTLQARSGSTQSGPYFAFSPTRCSPAVTNTSAISYRSATVTRASSFTPTGCDQVEFNPDFAISNANTVAGEPTAMSATLYTPTNDDTIQDAHLRDVSVILPAGTTLNIGNLNAVPAICTDAQLASDSCPAGSRIGSSSAAIPFLTGSMVGDIFLTGRGDGVRFGVVLRHPATGTVATFSGSSSPIDYGGSTIETTFTSLPQAPFSSATLDFTTPLVNNPDTCGWDAAWADMTGYTESRAIHGALLNFTDCAPPPETTITAQPPALGKDSTPTFEFTSDNPAATFECSVDSAAFAPCTSPFTTAQLVDGDHAFAVQAVVDGDTDASPATASFKTDTVKPGLTINSPADGEVLTDLNFTLDFSTEPGAVATCIYEGQIETCSSPKSYTAVDEGYNALLVSVRDAAGNSSYIIRTFTVELPKNPIVTISEPANGGVSVSNTFTPVFSIATPSGSPITSVKCELYSVFADFNYEQLEASVPDCVNSYQFRNLNADYSYRLDVEATDAAGLTGKTSSSFTPGPRLPDAYRPTSQAPSAAVITDRTPTIPMEYGDELYPDAQFECSLVVTGQPANWQPCGSSANVTPYQVTETLADGNYTLLSRAIANGLTSDTAQLRFTVDDWTTEYSVTTTNTDAGAHPDLDANIKITGGGQFRSVDMRLPKGLIGSLNSFPMCSLENVPTANCASETEVGNAATKIKINGLGSTLINASGPVYMTEPQVPGDVAGLVIRQIPPIDSFADVIIPLRVQLTENSQVMRVFSDSIPVEVLQIEAEEMYDFWVKDFKLHLNGSQGDPYPLLTNPSSCAASQFRTSLGDTEGFQTVSQTYPYQPTNCEALEFFPQFFQAFTNQTTTEVGALSGVFAQLTVNPENSSLRKIVVREPAAYAPNFNAFGSAANDRCKASTIVDTDPTSATNYVFNYSPANCPESARVGTMSIQTPLLPTTLTGEVYLVDAGSLPRFGVRLHQDGVLVQLAGITSVNSNSCDESVFDQGCPEQVYVTFDNIPDLSVTSVELDLQEESRPNWNGTQTLSSELLTMVPSYDTYVCRPVSAATTTITSWSGQTLELNQDIPIDGCDAP